MLLFGASAVAASLCKGISISFVFFLQVTALFVRMAFLGPALLMMLIYVWSQHNQHAHVTLLGLFYFRASRLPYVLLILSLLLGESVLVDIMGAYFFC